MPSMYNSRLPLNLIFFSLFYFISFNWLDAFECLETILNVIINLLVSSISNICDEFTNVAVVSVAGQYVVMYGRAYVLRSTNRMCLTCIANAIPGHANVQLKHTQPMRKGTFADQLY